MARLNKTFHIGNLTRSPELRYTTGGKAVCVFGLAVNEKEGEPLFLDVEAWERNAEIAADYLEKGDPVFVEGRLAVEKWEDAGGNRRTRVKIVATSLQLLARKHAGNQAAANENSAPTYPLAPPANAQGPRDEDLPF